MLGCQKWDCQRFVRSFVLAAVLGLGCRDEGRDGGLGGHDATVSQTPADPAREGNGSDRVQAPPDASAEASLPSDAAVRDAAMGDVTSDAGVRDAGIRDAAISDASSAPDDEAGPGVDSGPHDAGADATSVPEDAGTDADSGPKDAGADATSAPEDAGTDADSSPEDAGADATNGTADASLDEVNPCAGKPGGPDGAIMQRNRGWCAGFLGPENVPPDEQWCFHYGCCLIEALLDQCTGFDRCVTEMCLNNNP